MNKAARQRSIAMVAIAVIAGAATWRFETSTPPPGTHATTAMLRQHEGSELDRDSVARHVTLADLAVRPANITPGDRDPFAFRPRLAAIPASPARQLPFTSDPPTPRFIPVSSPPAPLPIRFIGYLERRTDRFAVFSDCAGYIGAARPGESILGRWKVMQITLDSVLVEQYQGTSTRIAMAGCSPR